MSVRMIVLAMILATASPVFAQDVPAWEIAGGYSSLKDGDDRLHGWFASLGGNVNSWLGIVGDVAANYDTGKDAFGPGLNFDLTEMAFLGGPRVYVRRVPGVTPFAHFLVGAVRFTGIVAAAGIEESESEKAVQFGGGVDLGSGRVALRLGVDLRSILNPDTTNNQTRFTAGVVIRGGER